MLLLLLLMLLLFLSSKNSLLTQCALCRKPLPCLEDILNKMIFMFFTLFMVSSAYAANPDCGATDEVVNEALACFIRYQKNSLSESEDPKVECSKAEEYFRGCENAIRGICPSADVRWEFKALLIVVVAAPVGVIDVAVCCFCPDNPRN